MSVTGTTFAASVGRGFLCCFSPISVACGAARPAVADYRSMFALDSPVEGDGFEPSVPRQKDNAFRDSSFPTCARATVAFQRSPPRPAAASSSCSAAAPDFWTAG